MEKGDGKAGVRAGDSMLTPPGSSRYKLPLEFVKMS